MRKVEINATAHGPSAREALETMVANLLASLVPSDSAPIVVQAHVVHTQWPPDMPPIRAKRFTAEGKIILLRAPQSTPIPGTIRAITPPTERSAGGDMAPIDPLREIRVTREGELDHVRGSAKSEASSK